METVWWVVEDGWWIGGGSVDGWTSARRIVKRPTYPIYYPTTATEKAGKVCWNVKVHGGWTTL